MTSDQNPQQDLTEEEIDKLIGGYEFDKRQTLQLEILNELFERTFRKIIFCKN